LWVSAGLVGSAMVPREAPRGSAGTISGKVTYTGTPPKMKPIDMAKEPSCAKQHRHPRDHRERRDRPRERAPLRGRVRLCRRRRVLGASEAVRYDQKGCQYIPHNRRPCR